MNGFINYALEANTGLILCLLLYGLLLRRETNFVFKRWYLLVGIAASLVFPFITIGPQGDDIIPSISTVLPSYLLPQITIGASEQALDEVAAAPNIWAIVAMIYWAGVALLSARFLYQVSQLWRQLKRTSAKRVSGGYKVIEVPGAFPTFSFFGTILIGHAGELGEEDKQRIIRHEAVHVDHLHSVDVLLVEVLKIVFWFNLLLPLYKKLFNNLHEYQADQEAVAHDDVNQYCSLLAKVALMSADFKLANHFTNSLTLKRITMMRTIKKRMSGWKLAVLVPIVVAFFVFAACQDQVLTEASNVAKSSSVALDVPQEVQAKYDALKLAKPEGNFVIVEVDDEGRAKLESMKDMVNDVQKNPAHAASINLITPTVKSGDPIRTFMIVEYNQTTAQVSEQSKLQGDVYTVVEESAEYPGGLPALGSFISSHLVYPEEARTKGLEGTVFVEFIINTDGSVSDVHAKKGADPVLDAEAIKVVQLLPAWKAGRQNGQAVRQQFVLPVKFNLGSPQKIGAITEEQKEFSVATNVSRINGKTIITGTVTDAAGNPVKGSNVLLAGSTLGTAVDEQGHFRLELTQSSGEIAVSHVGFYFKKVTF